MSFALSPLPFAPDAFEPHISAQTFSFHHGKHHKTYVENLCALVRGSVLENESLEGIIRASFKDESKAGVFNNAAQAWNHDFFWNSLSPDGAAPPLDIARRLDASFGSVADFKEQFKQAGTTQFGSGWVWLVQEKDGKLKIVKTANAMTPLVTDVKPLLTCDVWEHAYYLDYQNRRADYLQVFLDHLANWNFVAKNLG